MADATSYYEGWRKGIGRESYQRIIATEEDIIRRPEARRSLGAPCRRKLLKQIPDALCIISSRSQSGSKWWPSCICTANQITGASGWSETGR